MSFHPNNELVAVAFAKSILGTTGVATELPTDSETWPDGQFCTVETVGGTPDIETGLRKPVISFDFWAAASNSGRPPWNRASQKAEDFRTACLAHRTMPRVVTLPATYRGARVEAVIMRQEPRRIRGDVSSYAHYSMDVELWWKELA